MKKKTTPHTRMHLNFFLLSQEVVEIMKLSLFDRFDDGLGNIDFRRTSGMSKGKEVGRFIGRLQKIAEENLNSVFTLQQLYEISQELGIKVSNFEDFIDSLNTQNYLLKKGNRTYKLMTTNYALGVRSQSSQIFSQ
jgi:DNA helicase MCM8